MKRITEKENTFTQSLEGHRESLDFFEKILTEPAEPQSKREEVLQYCEIEGRAEHTVWRNLALFREEGSTEQLFAKAPHQYFDLLDEQLREQILVLIKKLPVKTLNDFREIITFSERFIGRVQFLCDLLLYFFLEKEKGAYRERWDMSLYTDFFHNKMFRELEKINEITERHPFQKLNEEYQLWLYEKLLDEEVLI